MKNIIKPLILILSIVMCNQSYSQVANYAFSETTGPYQAIVNNTAIIAWSGTISSASSNNTVNNLPFNFCMGGTSYTTANSFMMSHDGWAAFGSPTVTTTTSKSPLSNFNNCMSAFGTDLKTTGTSSYGARVEGTSPNRVLVLQWGQRYLGNSGGSSGTSNNYWRRTTVPNINGASTGDDTPGNNDRLHFQIRLYETTNVIEFCYLITDAPNTTAGNRHGGITNDVQVGLRGASAADFNVRTKTSTTTPWNTSTTAGTGLPTGSTNTMTFNNQRAVAANRPSAVTPTDPGSTTTTANSGTATIFRWTPIITDPSLPDGSISNCAIVLPVELIEFTAKSRENKVNNIKWTTASEQNSDYFIVERSLNGADWDIVGNVKSAGNSNIENNYSIEDRDFTNFINYYRLKQVDVDGVTKTYNMIYVDNRDSIKNIIKTVNLMGQEIDSSYQGMVIVIYSDGTTEKYYKR